MGQRPALRLPIRPSPPRGRLPSSPRRPFVVPPEPSTAEEAAALREAIEGLRTAGRLTEEDERELARAEEEARRLEAQARAWDLAAERLGRGSP